MITSNVVYFIRHVKQIKLCMKECSKLHYSTIYTAKYTLIETINLQYRIMWNILTPLFMMLLCNFLGEFQQLKSQRVKIYLLNRTNIVVMYFTPSNPRRFYLSRGEFQQLIRSQRISPNYSIVNKHFGKSHIVNLFVSLSVT